MPETDTIRAMHEAQRTAVKAARVAAGLSALPADGSDLLEEQNAPAKPKTKRKRAVATDG